MAYGSSRVMDIYCSLFARTFADDWSGKHKELSRWLRDHKIRERQPRGIQNHGIEKDRLLTFADVKGDNPLIDSLGDILANKDAASALRQIDDHLAQNPVDH